MDQFYVKLGEVDKFEYFQDILCKHSPEVYCVLLHTESRVCVLLCGCRVREHVQGLVN